MITPGTFLIQEDTRRPQSLELEEDSYANAWRPVKHSLNSFDVERELATGGWTFFLMAGEITATAFGFDRANMLRSAVKRLIADVKLQKCNCLEIDDVVTHSFLGVPYVNLSGHSRHIQKGTTFSGQ